MLKAAVLLTYISCALCASIPAGMVPQLDGRIVGGESTNIRAFPWQISLQRSGAHSCGGSIYSNNVIITAAHCLQRGVEVGILKVRAGSTYWNSGGVLLAVASFKNHEGYNPSTRVNDIAVIRLAASLSYSATIKPIGLASTVPANGAAAVVSGWGTMKSGSATLPSTLQFVNVAIMDRMECSSTQFGYGAEIQPTMICAAATGKDACQGDSGGPLVSGGELVGVVSWGFGCAHLDYPGVYADVAELHSWVVENAK